MEALFAFWKPQLANFLVVNGAYYAGLALLLWLLFLFYFQGREIVACLRRDWLGLIGSVVLAGLVFLLAHVGFRIFSDETSLLSVSENIAHGMRSLNSIQGYFKVPGDFGHFVAVINRVPTRPLMFPFLTACLHWILGVQPHNAIILNFIFLVLLLFTVWTLLRDKKIWLRALLLVALTANASLALHAPTGGFDLCSLCFGLWTFMALWQYLQKPRMASLVLLFLTAVCFVQIRYESLMILPFLLAAVLFYRGKKISEELRGQWLLLFLPFLLLPSLIQRIVTWGEFETPPYTAVFSFDYIPEHFSEFLQAFFFQWDSVYPVLLNLLGIAGIVFLLRQSFGRAKTQSRTRSQKVFLIFSLAYGLFLLVLLLSHYMGLAESSTQIRLFMPLSVLLFFAVAFGFSDSKWKNILVATCCVLQVGLGFYSVRKDVPRADLSIAFENEELTHLIKEHHLEKSLFLYRRPNHLISFGDSSVLLAYFQQNQELMKTLLKDHTVSSIYDVEAVLLKKPRPLPELFFWKRSLKYELPVTSEFELQIFEITL